MRMALRTAIDWLQDRAGLEAVQEAVKHKTVPVHAHSSWYFLGGMTLFFFIVQVVTGIMLMLYYRPSAQEAYESVQFIMTQVSFGWLIRSIHSWSANLMVVTALIHFFSVLFMKAYRRPRELTWMSGFVLLALSLGFGFSGYLLPWNSLAYFATRVGTDIAGSVPFIGDFIVRFLRGGDHVTGSTLSRFYGWHVAILPALTTMLLALHLFLVQRHGMSVPPSVEKSTAPKRHMPFQPDFLLRDLFGWTLALGVLAALAALFPWELGEKADPFVSAPANIQPEWYFMAVFQALKLVPGGSTLGLENEAIFILVLTGIGALAFLIPFLDRDVTLRGRSPVVSYVTGATLVAFVAFTALGYHAWWPVWVAAVITLGGWLSGRAMVRRREGSS